MKDIDGVLSMETTDYQNRDGQFPKSGIPDRIDMSHNLTKKQIEVITLFSGTREVTAKKWLERALSIRGFEVEVTTCQEGDYHDDWVTAYAKILY